MSAHEFPDDFDEDPELEREAMAMAEQLVRVATYLCLDPVQAPSGEQLLAVQAFFPHEPSIGLRRAIVEGNVRIGPFLPGPVFDFAQSSLRGVGLAWRAEPPNEHDLARFGLAAR